jgi:hypothetical protein
VTSQAAAHGPQGAEPTRDWDGVVGTPPGSGTVIVPPARGGKDIPDNAVQRVQRGGLNPLAPAWRTGSYGAVPPPGKGPTGAGAPGTVVHVPPQAGRRRGGATPPTPQAGDQQEWPVPAGLPLSKVRVDDAAAAGAVQPTENSRKKPAVKDDGTPVAQKLVEKFCEQETPSLVASTFRRKGTGDKTLREHDVQWQANAGTDPTSKLEEFK